MSKRFARGQIGRAAAVFLLLVLAATSLAQAQEPPRHPGIDNFEKEGGTAEHMGRALGLDGWILVDKEQNIKTVYTTPEGGMVMGVLVDDQGNNLTGAQLQHYRARLDGSQAAMKDAENSPLANAAEKAYAATEAAAFVVAGNAQAPYVYMFMNVNCDHCQKLWRDLQPAVSGGKLQIRLVPFGAAVANREGGAALLSVKDPGAAWSAYIAGDAAALSRDKIGAGALEKIDANTKLFKDRGMQGPPFTLYRRPASGEIKAVVGVPESTMVLLADVMKE
jgi:protein-disulfide isomerase